MEFLRLGRTFCLHAFILCLVVGSSEQAFQYDPFTPDTVTVFEKIPCMTRMESPVNCMAVDQLGDDSYCACHVVDDTIPFESFWYANDKTFYVYYDRTLPLTPDTTYAVPVSCKSSDQSGADAGIVVEHTLNVMVENKPPVITGYGADSTTVDGINTPKYMVVYQVAASDPEGEALNYTIVKQRGNAFSIGAGDGKIRANLDLRQVTSSSVDLTIAVTDGFNTIDNFIVTIIIDNKNSAPKFKFLPNSLSIDETAKEGDPIVSLELEDPDTYIDMNPVCTTGNVEDDTKFFFDSAGLEIKVAYDGALNYEDKDTYTIDCTVSDGYAQTTSTLTLNINDINEAPVWSRESYFCRIDEGPADGPFCTLNGNLVDPDGDPLAVDVVTSDSYDYFSYDYINNKMTFTVNYDLEAGYMDLVTAVMTATDPKGLSSSATVVIDVVDVNDNKCKTDTLLIFELTEFDDIQKLGMFSHSDDDVSAPNNELHFDVTSATPTNTALNHILVTSNGEIYYTNLFSYSQGGTTFRYNVRCVDGGSPAKFAETTLIVSYTVTPTTVASTTMSTTIIITTTTEKGLWDYVEFLAAFGTLMTILGIALIAGIATLIAYLCHYYGWSQKCAWCCKKTPKPPKPMTKKIVPYRPTPPPPRPPISHSWNNFAWRQDDGYELGA